MDSNPFDERFDRFTKSLANPTPRRSVLKGIVGTVVGAMVATFSPGHALANNSACAHFCNSVFAPGQHVGSVPAMQHTEPGYATHVALPAQVARSLSAVQKVADTAPTIATPLAVPLDNSAVVAHVLVVQRVVSVQEPVVSVRRGKPIVVAHALPVLMEVSVQEPVVSAHPGTVTVVARA